MARELVEAALAGDRSAWAGIWDLHGPKLHSYAWRLLGNDHDAQDAVADTFVSAAENLHQLRDPEQLRPWLYAICRRHVQRRWQLRDKVKPTDDIVAVVDAQEPAMNVLGIDAAEATSLLWEAAEGLGPAERELLSLVLTAQLDSGEVARVTGDKPEAVYVKVSRLKDGLGRAAGALLVARHHREDCAELDQLLQRLGRAVLRPVAQADRPARRRLRDLRRLAEDRSRGAVRHRRRRTAPRPSRPCAIAASAATARRTWCRCPSSSAGRSPSRGSASAVAPCCRWHSPRRPSSLALQPGAGDGADDTEPTPLRCRRGPHHRDRDRSARTAPPRPLPPSRPRCARPPRGRRRPSRWCKPSAAPSPTAPPTTAAARCPRRPGSRCR